jgi:molybdopterin synthase sulfur carrier subunit
LHSTPGFGSSQLCALKAAAVLLGFAPGGIGRWTPETGHELPAARLPEALHMPVVFIPSLMRHLTGGRERVRVSGSTVRQVINSLEAAHPGVRERIMEDGRIHPSVTVFVDGEQALLELLEPVGEDSEVHILPAVSGG